jgi:hypothetical protein
MDLSIKFMADNWGHAVAKILKKAFLGNSDQMDMGDYNAEVYDVNYGQGEQTFLISIHSEITNHLNPGEYLKEAAAFLYQLDSLEPFEIFYEIDIGDLEEQELTIFEQTIPTTLIPGGYSLPISFPSTGFPLGIGNDFLHAAIAEGSMEIRFELLDGSDSLNSNFDITYNDVLITQATTSYPGLSCSILSSDNVSLNEKDINNEEIKIDGSITIASNSPITLASGELKIKLTLHLDIVRLKEIDWDFSSIDSELNTHQIAPVSLAEVSPYVNYILYNEKEIGLEFEFNNVIDGLEMSIESEALDFDSAFQEIKEDGKIKFANENAGTLWLNGNRPYIDGYPLFANKTVPTANFDFKLVLRPKGGGNVLHIEPVGGIPLNPLTINGKAAFVQDWIEAQLNMVEIIKAAPYATGDYVGSIPKEGNDPIDLSMLTDYIKGFTFEDIQSEMHINGPHGVVNNPNLEGELHLTLKAYYLLDDASEFEEHDPPIYDDTLVLEENPLLLDAGYFDASGSYNKKDLPPGKPFSFSDIMDKQPQKLVFIYEIKIPDTIMVTHDLFEDETDIIDSKITVTILIMLPLKLTVNRPGPGRITFPDMFEDMGDLFGRSNLEEDSILKTLDIDYLKFSIGFTESFFNGGKLFMEKELGEGEERSLLFPDGIKLNGKKMAVNISGADFDIIKNNLIVPDLRLIFETPGSTLNVPRNIRLNNIKFEAKGKFEF